MCVAFTYLPNIALRALKTSQSKICKTSWKQQLRKSSLTHCSRALASACMHFMALCFESTLLEHCSDGCTFSPSSTRAISTKLALHQLNWMVVAPMRLVCEVGNSLRCHSFREAINVCEAPYRTTTAKTERLHKTHCQPEAQASKLCERQIRAVSSSKKDSAHAWATSTAPILANMQTYGAGAACLCVQFLFFCHHIIVVFLIHGALHRERDVCCSGVLIRLACRTLTTICES